MRNLSLKQYSKEQLLEMSLIEMAYDLLVERNEPIPFKDLISELASLHHLSKAEVAKKIAQFYTDLNVDGRFTSLGDNRWGLKTWYPVDQIEEEVVHVVKPKKKKKAKKALSLSTISMNLKTKILILKKISMILTRMKMTTMMIF